MSVAGVTLVAGCAHVSPPRPVLNSVPFTLHYDAARTLIVRVQLAGQVYITVSHPDVIGRSEDIGLPALPRNVVYLALPLDATDVSVQLQVVNSTTVARNEKVVPTQPPKPTSSKLRGNGLAIEAFAPAPPVAIDAAFYASDTVYPRQVVTLEQVTKRYNALVAVVGVAPFAFYPREGRTEMRTSLSGTLTFRSAQPIHNLYQRLPPPQLDTLRRIVKNPQTLASVSLATPAVAPLGSQADYVVADPRPATHDAVPYVVITTAALAPSFQPLADWKTGKGIDTRVVTVEWIQSRYPGVDLANKVRNFILDAVAKWGTSWVLLGGDVDHVPARLAVFDGAASSYGPSDLYYSGLGTNWNSNGNQVFGEFQETDINPDIFVGRAPVRNPTEVAVFVGKTVYYEQLPTAGYVERALLMAASENGAQYPLHADQDKEANKLLIPPGFTVTRMYDAPSTLMPDVVLNRANAITEINKGYHIVNHMDHSGIQSMGTGAFAGGGALTNADADGFTNPWPGSIVWTYGCDPNAFDYDSISEHWMRNPSGGAVAFIGNTRTGYSSQDSQDHQFFTSWFTDKLRHLGAIFSSTQAVGGGSYTSGIMNLMGDPALAVWNAQPLALTLSNLGTFTTGPNAVSLTVSNLVPGEEATVTFRGPNGEVYAGGTTVGGTLAGTLIAHTATPLDIVVTSPDRLPVVVSAPVSASTGAHLYVSGVQVIDTTGNGNQQLEPGESALLRVTIRNGGGAASGAGPASLTASTAGVTVTGGAQTLQALAVGGLQAINFPIALVNAFSDGATLLFDLATSGAGIEHTNIRVPVFAPILEQTHVYDDSAGNGNGVPEAGETVRFGLHVINNGFGDAYGVTATLTANTAAVTVTDGVATIGNVLGKSDASVGNVFTIVVGSSFNPSVDTVRLTMTDSLGNTTTQDITLVVPAPPTGMTYRHTSSSLTPMWNPAAPAERNYKIYRSASASGPYTKIEPFLVRDGALYEDTTIDPNQPSYFYGVSNVDASGNESRLAQVQAWTPLPALTGFPQPVSPADAPITGHTMLFDVNRDGRKEVFVTTAGGVLYAWKADGTALNPNLDPNFAKFAVLDGANYGAPAFADLDGDGEADIIVNGLYRVYAFRADGSSLPGWAGGIAIPKAACMGNPPAVANTSPLVVDLYGNGRPSVVTTAFDWGEYCDGSQGHVYVIDYDPTNATVTIQGYHVPGGNYSYAVPAVTELNGKPALVTPFSTGEIWLLDPAATPPFTRIVTVTGAIFRNEASMADLDGDGKPDIIVASQFDFQHPSSNADKVFAFRLDGMPVAGWLGGQPLSPGDRVINQWSYSSALAVADLDCDGRPEVVLGTERHVYIWEHDGKRKNGWPVARQNKLNWAASAASPLIVDLTGEGRLGVVIGSSTLIDGGIIEAWDAKTATPINAFPQSLPETISRTTAIGDIDGNGLLEVAQGAGSHMYVFKTSGRAFAAFMPWPNINRNATHTSALSAADMGAACCTTLTPAAGAWWPFNETAGTTAADIAGGHDGTHKNGPTPVTGVVGQALAFNGVNSYVVVPHHPAIDLSSGQFTLDFWIRPDVGETQGTIFRKGALVGAGPALSSGFHLFYDNGHFLGYLAGTSSSFQVAFSSPFIGQAVPGRWTFVALAIDLPGQTTNLYINGQPVQTVFMLNTPGNIANTAPVIIGGTDVAPSAVRSFAGALDELRLENRILTASEIQKIYAAGPAGTCGSVSCLGPKSLQVGTGDGYASFTPDETGGIYSCDSGLGDPSLPGIRFDPPGSLPAANSNCSTKLYVFDQAKTRRQALSVHAAATNTCSCTPAPDGACFYEPLCGPNDAAHLTCSDVVTDSGVITLGGAPKQRITEFTLPNFPGLKVRLTQEAFVDRLQQTYQFTNTSNITYSLRLSRVSEIDLGYADDGTAMGKPQQTLVGYASNRSVSIPFGAAIHDNVKTGAANTPAVTVSVTAPDGSSSGSDATFEGVRLQGNGGSSHARTWWNYGVPPTAGVLNVYGVDGDYWTVTWTSMAAPPLESDQAVVVQSLLTIPAGQTKTYVTHTSVK